MPETTKEQEQERRDLELASSLSPELRKKLLDRLGFKPSLSDQIADEQEHAAHQGRHGKGKHG